MYRIREDYPGTWTVGKDGPAGWEPTEVFDDIVEAKRFAAHVNKWQSTDGDPTTNAIDAARVAIDEQRYERAQALAAVAQAEALVQMSQHLANISNGLAAIHLYGAGRDEQADNFALWRTE